MPLDPQDDRSLALLQALLSDPRYRGVTANMLSMPERATIDTAPTGSDVLGYYRPSLGNIRVGSDHPDGQVGTLAHETLHYMSDAYSPSLSDRVGQLLSDLVGQRTPLHDLIYKYGEQGAISPGQRPTYGPLEESVARPGDFHSQVTGQREIPQDPKLMKLLGSLIQAAVQDRHRTTLEALK
jgi:hypothetical protein